MKVCLVHEEYPEETNFGGIATYQKNLAEELVKKGNEVIVICRGMEKNQYYIENGVRIYRIFNKKCKNQIREYKNYRIKVCKLLRKLQKNNEFDIIEVPDWGAETVFFEKYRKVPLVVRLHTPLKVWLKYNKNNFGKVSKYLLEWEEKMLLSADRITCCSNALKEIIVKEFPIERNRILVNPNPANITNFYRDEKIKKQNMLLYVGSLEERKGVCVLANALNKVLKEYPTLEVCFIGKDTTRNSRDISTITFIKEIIDKKYHSNVTFMGHIPNNKLNYYFNSALVGVFPSLFDNFPYVVLESMSTGLHIVGSKNSGMVEMLEENDNIYNSGDSNDLAKKIIATYEKALKDNINNKNIERVKYNYSPDIVCKDIYNDYKKVIEDYNSKIIEKDDLYKVLANVSKKKIIKYKKMENGVANVVYLVKTLNKQYIVKKYLYDYNFELSKRLYKIYEKDNINAIKPLNSEPIYSNNSYYNIFEYLKNDNSSNLEDIDFFTNLICCNREDKFNISSNKVSDKIEKYKEYLQEKKKETLCLQKEEIDYVIEVFEKIKGNKIFKEEVLNHGDISRSNIIINNKKKYLIDFDETCIANILYDFAVIVVKFFQKDGKLDMKKYELLKENIKNYLSIYEDNDYINSLEYYLCKILLEKYYLYETNKIDLFDENQKKDYYKNYLNLLKNINKMEK